MFRAPQTDSFFPSKKHFFEIYRKAKRPSDCGQQNRPLWPQEILKATICHCISQYIGHAVISSGIGSQTESTACIQQFTARSVDSAPTNEYANGILGWNMLLAFQINPSALSGGSQVAPFSHNAMATGMAVNGE